MFAKACSIHPTEEGISHDFLRVKIFVRQLLAQRSVFCLQTLLTAIHAIQPLRFFGLHFGRSESIADGIRATSRMYPL